MTQTHQLLTSQKLYNALLKNADNRREDGIGLFIEHDGLVIRPFNSGDTLPELNADDGQVILHQDYHLLAQAARLGWRTAWYNPEGRLAPEPMPIQDADVSNLGELTNQASTMDKPTLAQVLAWWADWGLPENIRRHSQTVAWAAYALGVLLQHADEPVDPILAHRGGLLHDLDKLKTLEPEAHHGGVSADFLQEQGYPKLAEIVSGHVLHTALQPGADSRPWEERLVFFCDKLAEEDRIIPFDRRLDALRQRYPDFRDVMDRAEPAVWAVNDAICQVLSIPSHEKLIETLIKLQNN